MLNRVAAATCVALAIGLSDAHAGDESYVAVTWSDQAVHVLDGDLNDVRSFSAGGSNPNGVATDGRTVWAGHFSTQEVIAYDLDGNELFRWGTGAPNLQGMELLPNDEIYLTQGADLQVHDARDGTLLRTVPNVGGGSVEGMAWDGEVLWLLQAVLIAVDPDSGAELRRIANAAESCSFNGSGVTASAPGELTLACTDGRWFRVSSTDGSVLASGSNGLNMYGLKSLAGGGCGEKSKLIAKCKGGGTKVVGKLKKADPNIRVTFRVDGGTPQQGQTNNKGKAKTKWKNLDEGGHEVTVCDLVDECS